MFPSSSLEDILNRHSTVQFKSFAREGHFGLEFVVERRDSVIEAVLKKLSVSIM